MLTLKMKMRIIKSRFNCCESNINSNESSIDVNDRELKTNVIVKKTIKENNLFNLSRFWIVFSLIFIAIINFLSTLSWFFLIEIVIIVFFSSTII